MTHQHHHIYHKRFNVLTSVLTNNLQAFLSLVMFLLTFLSFISLLIKAFHVFLGHALRKLSLTLKVLYALDQALSSIHFRRPNHCSLLSSKHSLVLFKLSLVLVTLKKSSPQVKRCTSI